MRRLRVVQTAIFLAAAIPWLLGLYAVFFVSAQYTGLGLVESYLAFQGGSSPGNAISFGAWSGATGTACWLLVRRIGRYSNARIVASSILFAYAAPAALLIFPDAAIGFVVSHVRAFEGENAPYSAVALSLIQSGAVALVLGAMPAVANYLSARKARTLSP